MFIAMPTEQVGGAGADAAARDGACHCFAQRRMLGEAQVIVAGKVEQALAIDDDAWPVDLLDGTQAAQQAVARTCGLRVREAFEQIRAQHRQCNTVQAAALVPISACTVPDSIWTCIGSMPRRA